MAPTADRPREAAASPGLLVIGVAAAPAAVLAQLDPVRVVALRLLALVVAPLALLASQRHCDSDVPAGHGLLERFGLRAPRRKDPGGAARSGLSVAPDRPSAGARFDPQPAGVVQLETHRVDERS